MFCSIGAGGVAYLSLSDFLPLLLDYRASFVIFPPTFRNVYHDSVDQTEKTIARGVGASEQEREGNRP